MIGFDWQSDAACASPDIDTAIFFPESGGASSLAAKKVCARCPVKDACLAHAVKYMERGVWGGTNDYDRRHARRASRAAA